MGFDIECIIDIHTYPGEYFCPVCRTLVYPNEAVQSQCTHLYCKPCLAHVANGTKACPYDGYLVAEADSKPLIDSDKALAENIGKVKVHCLFFRSGCTWEGTLSECNSHCSGCSFGNSPVICNRCGVQIVHRQVHEHAQSCPAGASSATGSGTTSSTVEMNQPVAQSTGAPSQAVNPQNPSSLMSGQNTNQSMTASSQASLGVVPATVPTPEQLYQQQYQQYYQQYPGYQPYQQPGQQYYPLQQYPFQQHQQHPVPVQCQFQSQPQAQPQAQPLPLQPQNHFVPQNPQQPQLQTQVQGQAHPQVQGQAHPQVQGQVPAQVQGQNQPQSQLQLLPQPQPQVQVPPQGQAQSQPVLASVPNYQVNQQYPHHLMRPQPHVPLQSIPPAPQGQPASYTQGTGPMPSAQHAQVPQYQQPLMQMQHPQTSQSHVQPQTHPQPLNQPPPSNQAHVQNQQQAHLYHAQSQSHVRPPQANQTNVPAAMPHGMHPPLPPVSGYHSYQQPHGAQQMHPGFSQQLPVQPQPVSGSLHPVQVHGQVQQQLPLMRPPHSLGSLPQQPSSTMVPPQNQLPSNPQVQNQQFPPHSQPPNRPLQQHPAMQPVQHNVPQQYTQQQHFPAPFQGQLHQQGHYPQQPLQPLRPYGTTHSQQFQNSIGRPMIPNPGMHMQSNPQSGGINPVPHSGSVQLGAKQPSINHNTVESTKLEQNEAEQATRSPLKGLEKGFEQESVKKESDMGGHETLINNGGNTAQHGSVEQSIKQEEVDLDGSLDQAGGGKSSEVETQEGDFDKMENNKPTNSNSMKQVDLENQDVKLPIADSGASSDEPSHMAASASGTDGNVLNAHSSQQQRPQVQVPRRPPSVLGPQGPGQRELDHFGPPSKYSESHALGDSRGIIGRAPFPLRHTYGDEPNFPTRNVGTVPDPTMFGSRNEKLKNVAREHFNPFSAEPTQSLGPAPGSINKSQSGPNYDGSRLDHSALGPHPKFLPSHHSSAGHGHLGNFGPGSEFEQHHLKHYAPRSPGNEYLGISSRGFGGPSFLPRGDPTFDDANGHRFGEGSRSFDPSPDFGIPFHDGRFLPTSMRHGTGNLRFGDHMAPRPLHNNNRNDDGFGLGGPGHFMKREFSGPGNFSGMRSSYPLQPNFAGGSDSFDQSRRRRPMSAGWCRICKIDCETVEGLDMHSQTREHQKMAMDLVKIIKQQNRKKQRTSAAHEGGRARKTGPEHH